MSIGKIAAPVDSSTTHPDKGTSKEGPGGNAKVFAALLRSASARAGGRTTAGGENPRDVAISTEQAGTTGIGAADATDPGPSSAGGPSRRRTATADRVPPRTTVVAALQVLVAPTARRSEGTQRATGRSTPPVSSVRNPAPASRGAGDARGAPEHSIPIVATPSSSVPHVQHGASGTPGPQETPGPGTSESVAPRDSAAPPGPRAASHAAKGAQAEPTSGSSSRAASAGEPPDASMRSSRAAPRTATTGTGTTRTVKGAPSASRSQTSGQVAQAVLPALIASLGPSGTTRAAGGASARSPVDLPGVAGQLLEVLSAPRPLPGGSTTLTIALHPPFLGAVEAKVVTTATHVTVQLSTRTPEAESVLRAALPELRASLSSNGQQASVSLGDSGQSTTGSFGRADYGGAQQPPRPQVAAGATSTSQVTSAAATTATSSTAVRSGLVDIRV